MNTKIKSMVAGSLLLATLNLSVVSARAAPLPTAGPSAQISATAPRVVANRTLLSAQEIAMYQQKTSESKQAANGKAAGAADNKTVWIVVGVVVVVGVIALAAGGGGGGGGGY